MSVCENGFRLPSEAHPSLGGWFNPDFGLGDVGGKPLPNEEVLPLLNSTLGRFGFTPVDSRDLAIPELNVASEVGDDEIEVSNSKASVALNLVFSGLLGMKESKSDTCISTRYGNFCEELIVLPDGYDQTYHKAKNTSSYRDMSFIDVPKLRLATNIRPMRMDHSATNDGKAGMVGSRLKWLTNDNPMKIIYELFSLFQDINLGLRKDKKCAYLPTELGGYGKPIPFSNPSNFERFLSSYKNGAHSPVIRTIVRRASRFMDKVVQGKHPGTDVLLNHVTRFAGSFHDWVKGHSIYAQTAWIDIPENLVRFQVGKLGVSHEKDDIFHRLLAEGVLVTESKLQVIVEHNALCSALAKPIPMPEFGKIRKDATKEWRKISVFGAETYGLIEEIKPDQTDFRSLRDVEVSYFFQQVGERKGFLKSLFRAEPVYSRDAIDHVYRNGPMFVRFSMTPRNKIGGIQFVNQTRFREDFVDSEDRQGMEEAIKWLSDGMVGKIPTRMINDDSVIIKMASEIIGGLVIVTDDKQLCRSANRKTKTPIFRVPCEWYYRCVYFGDNPAPWMDYLSKKTAIEWSQVEDQGSLVSAEENLFNDGMMLKHHRRQPFSMVKEMGEKDRPYIVEQDNYSDEPPGSPDQFLYDYYRVMKRR